MRGAVETVDPATPVIWISGRIITVFNKIVFPLIWLCFLCIGPLWIYRQTGQLSVRRDFYFIVAFFLTATVFLAWVTVHLHLVGYRGRQLIVSSYSRQAAIPFEMVEAVESVWWYKGRMVRIRFRDSTPFGTMIYYLPTYSPLRTMFSHPEKELQEILQYRD